MNTFQNPLFDQLSIYTTYFQKCQWQIIYFKNCLKTDPYGSSIRSIYIYIYVFIHLHIEVHVLYIRSVNPFNAELYLFKPWRLKVFCQFEITIIVLFSSYRFIWIPILRVYHHYKYLSSFNAGIV